MKRIEVALLVFFVVFGRKLKRVFGNIGSFLWPKIRNNWRVFIAALVILYVIGIVVFAIRLYKQQRFEKIDLIASNIYPFPVAHSGRAIVFNGQLQRWVYSSKVFASKNNLDMPKDLPQRVIKELADYKAVAQEADRMGVRVTQKYIDDKFQISIEGVGNIEQARDFIKQMYGISLERFKAMIHPAVTLEKIKEDKFVCIKVRHILIKDESRAKEVLDELKKGGNFADIAKDRSEDEGSKGDGGLVAGGEFIYRGSGLVKEFEDVAFKLEPGKISDLVKTEFGYHIIKVDAKKGTINQPVEKWLNALNASYPQSIWL